MIIYNTVNRCTETHGVRGKTVGRSFKIKKHKANVDNFLYCKYQLTILYNNKTKTTFLYDQISRINNLLSNSTVSSRYR